MDGRTHAASVVQSFGGVGRNLADAFGRLLSRDYPPPLFISAVGRDAGGEAIISDLRSHLDTSGILISPDEPTSSYTALLDRNGECLMGIGNMEANMLISVEHVKRFESFLKQSPILIIDGNVPQETMDYVLGICQENGVPVWFEPTDVKKAPKAFKKNFSIEFASPNLNELRAIAGNEGYFDYKNSEKPESPESILKETLELSHNLINRVNAVFVTLGRLGVMVTRRGKANEPLLNRSKDKHISSRLYPAPKISKFISVSGAGDCFAAALAAGVLRGITESECLSAASSAAALSIGCPSTVPSGMKADDIIWNIKGKYIACNR